MDEELAKAKERAAALEDAATDAVSDVLTAAPGWTSNAVTRLEWNSTVVITLSITILLFGLCIIGVMAFLILKGCDAQQVLRAFCVPTIIVAAIFLVVTGYDREQLTPVIGLLGTIAGYLLGTRERGPTRTVPEPAPEAPSVKQKAKKKEDANVT